MNKKILYHGSKDLIKQPIYGYGKIYNDYGLGFYCTIDKELAKEWASSSLSNGYCNCYEFDESNLKILDLSNKEYNVLHWLAILINHRKINLSTGLMKINAKWLLDNYYIDVDKYDVIKGYRADDSYFTFARLFLNNTISMEQLNYAIRLGDLGEQIVLKSKKAFSQIIYKDSEEVESDIYFKIRKIRDENAYESLVKSLEVYDVTGTYLTDLIRRDNCE